MTIKQPIQEFSIDKCGWQKVKLGNIVFEPKESIKNPASKGVKHVVGLEHIDSEDIHLRRSASIEESTTFTKKFSAGDVLFGRRRAYLKKAARANFDGICSGDITIMRANNNLLPELLPFIVNNDKFFDFAVKHSAGGLSPRVKFKDLAEYEVLIPPVEEQDKVASLLNSLVDMCSAAKRLKNYNEIVFQAERKSLIEYGVLKTGPTKQIKFGCFYEGWPVLRVGDVCKLVGGNAFKSTRFKDVGKHQVLRIGNITNNGFDLKKSPVFIDDLQKSEDTYLIPKGAIVLSLTGTNGKRDYGFPSLMFQDKVHLLNQRLVMLIADKEKILPEYLHVLAKMEFFQARFFLNATGSANQANVSVADVSDIEIPVPPMIEQIQIVDRLDKIKNNGKSILDYLDCSNSMFRVLLGKVF